MKQPTKAVICAAGLGTRFLPQTKAMPKEMLPIVDRPVIQLIVEELVAAGVEDIILVTSSNKRTVEDHFDKDEGLEAGLILKGKHQLAEQLGSISDLAN
ncbi:MAG: NTP transferase domain-containing protein, partial [bacterium]|nr:NTP transferase domain-containing protein [bacterium]